MVEFEVVGEVKTTGTKTNSKGDEIEISKTTYSLREVKPKEKEGKKSTMSIVVENDDGTKLSLSLGDAIDVRVSKKQKKLEG